MNIDNQNGTYRNLPPPSNNGLQSVRSSVQRQRLFINVNNQKRQAAPASFDPTLSDQRRKFTAINSHLSNMQNSSADSRGINFYLFTTIGANSTSSNGRAVQKKGLIAKLPLQKLTHQNYDQSPRDNQLSDRSKQGQKNSSRHHFTTTQNSSNIPSQRKITSATYGVNKPQHQLGYRRQQIMDITDDTNTNSQNRLTIQLEGESIEHNDNREQHHSQPAPIYNMFYHGSSGEQKIGRFNSKKQLRVINKQPSKKEISYQQNANEQQPQLFQFTKKQTLVSGDNSLSSTREKTGQQLFKIKKQSVQQIQQEIQQQVPQIGKRKPIIIRKNNFLASHNLTNLQDTSSNISHNNNMNTLMSANSNRINNTNNTQNMASSLIGGGMSEASNSQSRYGITQILKSLNSTAQSNELSSTLQQTNLQLRDNRLIKINRSKKKLDTARKSRIHQLQTDTSANTTTQNLLQSQQNSLSQQPETRQQPVLSFISQKKRSLIAPKVKIDNNSQQPLTQSFLPQSNNLSQPRPLSNRQENQKDLLTISTAQNIIYQPLPVHNQQPMSIKNVHIEKILEEQTSAGGVSRFESQSEERKQLQTENNVVSTQQTGKFLKRGQILRMVKQKQQLKEEQKNTIEIDLEQHAEGSLKLETIQSEAQILGGNSLTRIESKKDLIKKEENKGIIKSQKSQHQVKEELVIHENINDSSCTPAHFSNMNMNASEINHNEIILEQNQNDFQTIEKPSVQNEQDDNFQTLQTTQDFKQTQVDTGSIQNVSKTGQKQNKNMRLFNNSANPVKSPLGTAFSMKSQNSQQAGPNPDEVISFPMRPSKALKLFLNQLTDYEKGEILDYQEIYFMGFKAQKIHGTPKNEHNYGYDDEKGDYKIIMQDHIGYRYEILTFLGKGSFGTAIKCFDHKLKEEVALKIVKNKKKYQYQAGIELKILNFLQENDPDDIMNVVHMKDYVIFRKHLCISFELLSMNLFEFLKINDFSGFDHNLIRRFAIQLLYALKYLKEFNIIHCDLKPENILLKEPNKSGIKIIDFGSSTFIDERVYTYIQSRFYRAPEIMLGIPYTTAIDMWSFGCIMAELFIGYPIFPGESENDQMSRIIEMINIPSKEVYDVSQRRQKFFKEDTTGSYEPIMLKNSRGKMRRPGGKPLKLLMGEDESEFLDFVEKCLEWNPETRMTPDEALRHVWVLKGLPPQVLIHHQRMHNIATPELPQQVRDARDKFFLEQTIENTSQLGGNRGKGSAQQSSNTKGLTSSQTKNKSQKNETIKSLERAQLKNQLHQLNTQKQHQNLILQTKVSGSNVVLHNKLTSVPQNANNEQRVTQIENGSYIQSHKTQPLVGQQQNLSSSEAGQGFKRRVAGRQIIQKNLNNAKPQQL